MWFPERAMIRTPTIEDARRLSEILQRFGMRYADDMIANWNTDKDQTAFDYTPSRAGWDVLHADLAWYEQYRHEDDMVKLIPDGCYMLSVDEFIQMCELEDAEESDVDFASIL